MSDDQKAPDTKNAISILDRSTEGAFAFLVLDAVLAVDVAAAAFAGKNLLTLEWKIGGPDVSVGGAILFVTGFLLLMSLGSGALISICRYLRSRMPEPATAPYEPSRTHVTADELEQHALSAGDALLMTRVDKAREQAASRRSSGRTLLAIIACCWPLLLLATFVPGTTISSQESDLLTAISALSALPVFLLFLEMLGFSDYHATQVHFPPLAQKKWQRWKDSKSDQ
jgi:cytochrome c-type biogenesis protein CcmH/NrfG